jgi:hypothetical protein
MNQHWFFPFFCSKWLRENVPTMWLNKPLPQGGWGWKGWHWDTYIFSAIGHLGGRFWFENKPFRACCEDTSRQSLLCFLWWQMFQKWDSGWMARHVRRLGLTVTTHLGVVERR